MFKTLTKKQANNLLFESWKVGELVNLYYSDLIRILGEPTYNTASGDEKTQVEWVIEFNGKYFTIYDWKTYNKDFTLNGLDVWSIGGNCDPTEFIDLINNKK